MKVGMWISILEWGERLGALSACQSKARDEKHKREL